MGCQTKVITKYQCQDGQIVDGQYLCPHQKQDSNKISTNVKEDVTNKNKDSWFDTKSNEVKLLLNKDYEKFNCSKSDNFGKEKILFQIVNICKFSENHFLYGLYNEEVNGIKTQDECKSKGGNWIPYLRKNVEYDAYPSLKEFYLYQVPISLENTGCTKIDISSYYLRFAVYHNNIKTIEKSDSSLLQWWTYQHYGNEFLFPGKDLFTEVSFDKDKPAGDTPNDYTFKICLLNKSDEIISCDKINFNME